MGSSADLLFINGQVITMDPRRPMAEALGTWGNRIAAVGTTAELAGLKGPATRVIDLRGKSLLPGFIDAHCHLADYGMYLTGVDCRYPAVRSIADIQEKIRRAVETTPPGQWIRGLAYDHKKLREGRHPTRWELDAAAPRHPAVVFRTCYHIAVANSRALELAGITADTLDPKGGRILRDENGQPNGVLADAALKELGGLSEPSPDELRGALIEGAKGVLAHGITSIHDAGGPGPVQMQAVVAARRAGALNVRVYMLLWSSTALEETHSSFLGARIGSGFGDDWLRIGHFKLMVDGSSSGPTAAMRAPYDSNPEDSGLLYYSEEEVADLFSRAYRCGYQLTAHGVGDRGVEVVVNGIRAATEGAEPLPVPPRIEHCGFVDPDLLRRIKALNIMPIPQPAFIYDFGDGYLQDYGRRTRYMFACRSFFDHGIVAAASSDCPVTSPNPMLGVYAAMTRKTRTGQVVGPEEAVSLQEALRMYTVHGARASGEADRKGSLAVGKLADLAVLSDPILDVGVETIKDVQVVMTIVDGRGVFER